MENLFILAGFLGLGLLTLILMEWRERKKRTSDTSTTSPTSETSSTSPTSDTSSPSPEPLVRVPVDDECCGRHAVCERESLLTTKPEIIYYEDEELDRLVGVPEEDYSEQDLLDFNEVFTTLQPQDVAGWLRSLQLRNIAIPEALKEEALMIVAERRFAKSSTPQSGPAQG